MSASALLSTVLLHAAVASADSISGSLPPPPAPAAGPAATVASMPMYVSLSGSSTLSYLPAGGALLGPQADFSPSVGFGVAPIENLYFAFDVSPTFTAAGFSGLTLMPGSFWCFHPNLYVAGRLGMTVLPAVAYSASTGLGAMLTLDSHVTLFAEAGAFTSLGRPVPDVGATLSLGAFYNF
jgi:hypothetical protein